ncbi:MAG: hydrogenase [Clostridiales bacterium]|jgi:hydrogenase-4 component E|nr:hydrogenase [Clostridiales bacterium]
MINVFNSLLVMILALNLLALGSRSILSVIRIIAIQGILLGILPLILHEGLSIPQVVASLTAISMKGVVIPMVMIHAMKNIRIKREVEPIIGFVPSSILGAVITGSAFLLSNQITVSTGGYENMIIPAAITTILVGFIQLITRYKAISQVVGYLVLENGIYIFSLLLIEAIPLIVEMGMLLDLFVSIFIISIITNHINNAFSSLDTRRLTTLKE